MPLKTQLSDAPAPNLTPMIDVVFLIIIFFMVGTNFTRREHKIEIVLPQVESEIGALTPKPEQRVITVSHDGRITLDAETVTLDQLVAELRNGVEQFEGLAVIVRGSATGPFGNVARVLSGIRRAGVSEMDIAVRPNSSGSRR